MLKTCLGKLHSLCYFMIADCIQIHVYIYIYIYIYQWRIQSLFEQFFWVDIYIYNFMTPFCGWGATASRLYRATTRRQFTFYRKFLVLIRSILEGWKAEMSLKAFTKYKLYSQFKLTELWPLTVNCFKMSSQSYLAGLSKICFLCTYVDQMIIQ